MCGQALAHSLHSQDMPCSSPAVPIILFCLLISCISAVLSWLFLGAWLQLKCASALSTACSALSQEVEAWIAKEWGRSGPGRDLALQVRHLSAVQEQQAFIRNTVAQELQGALHAAFVCRCLAPHAHWHLCVGALHHMPIGICV